MLLARDSGPRDILLQFDSIWTLNFEYHLRSIGAWGRLSYFIEILTCSESET